MIAEPLADHNPASFKGIFPNGSPHEVTDVGHTEGGRHSEQEEFREAMGPLVCICFRPHAFFQLSALSQLQLGKQFGL